MLKRIFFVFSCVLAVITTGCGGDDDIFSSSDTEVREMDVQDDFIQLGQSTVVAADFSYDTGDIADGDNVALVIEIPPTLRFREGSAEVDGSFGDDDNVGAITTSCADGTTYHLFNLDRFDLDSAAVPGGGADGRLTFTVDTVARGENITIAARADEDNVSFSCELGLVPDEQVVLSVR